MKRHPFREIKRVVSQFFETEYWYRWRSKKDTNGFKIRNVSHLNDTWNGHNTLIQWQIMKIEHMMHNLRKYGNELDCYIDSPDMSKYANADDRQWAIDYVMHEMIKDCRQRCTDTKYYITYRPGEWVVSKRNLVKTIPASEVENPSFTLEYVEGESEDDWDIIRKPCDEKIYEFEEVMVSECFYDAIDYMGGPPVLDDLIKYEHSFNITPADYKKLSGDLRTHIRGNKRKLRDLWLLRKYLKKLNEMDFSWSEPYRSMTNAIYKELKDMDDDYKHRYMENCYQKFLDDRRAILNKISDLWNERCDMWWD